MSPQRRAVALLAVLALVWGTNWPLFPYAVAEVSVWTFRSVSMCGSGLLLMAVAHGRGLPLAVPRRYWPVLGVAAACNLSLWNVASTYAALLIPSGQAALLGFTMPLWAALFAGLFLRESIGPRVALALGFGAAGVGLLIWRGAAAYAQAPLGAALGLLAAVSWAAGTLVIKRSGLGNAGIPANVLTAWQMLIAAIPIVLVALLREPARGQPWFMPSLPSVLVIAYMTVIPMSLGSVVWFSIVGLLPAHVAGLGSVAVPMVAMLAGALVHGEPLGAVQWAAMACCGAGLVLALPRGRQG